MPCRRSRRSPLTATSWGTFFGDADLAEIARQLRRPGIYILIGFDENAEGEQVAYIGEARNVADRLSNHNAGKSDHDSKNFWTDTITLFSNSQNEKLHKGHTLYAEACLIRSAGKIPFGPCRTRKNHLKMQAGYR
ncbi:MAG: GIY-YIG nuclease family protein [Rhodobacteraceae bacterium]|nr:GIY-YIG nuclease family protein [Paracoccaceae bacterium]